MTKVALTRGHQVNSYKAHFRYYRCNGECKYPAKQRMEADELVFDCILGHRCDLTGFDEASGQLPGPVGVHAWPLDENKVSRTEAKDADPKRNNLEEKAYRDAGRNNKTAGDLEGRRDDENVHEVEGVAHTASESDPSGLEETPGDGAIEGGKISWEHEKRKRKRDITVRNRKDRPVLWKEKQWNGF
jgi:hypothetical protein